MKDLLHNKNFKKRLVKWTILYCAVLCLFAIVVTYSKYVSLASAPASVRAAKFDVDIKQEISCSDMIHTTPKDIACFDKTFDETEGVRAREKVGFYFTLDTSELEVNSKIVLTTTIKKDDNNYFNDYKLYDVTNLRENNEILNEKENILSTQITEEKDKIILEYIKDYNIKDNKNHTYLLVLDYDYNKYKYDYLYLNKDLISVGYSAVQID